jgi:hypothetical protein
VSILYRPRSVGKISAKSLLFCCAAVAIVAALAGCGGGGSSSSESTATAGETSAASSEGSGKGESSAGGGSSGKSGSEAGESAPGGEISDSAFVKQANAICEESKKQSLEKMSAYVKEHGGGGSSKQRLAQLKEAIEAVVVPAIQGQAEEIRELSVSGGDEAKVKAFATALEEGVEDAERAKGSSTAPFAQSFKRSAELAHEYGLDGCAYG